MVVRDDIVPDDNDLSLISRTDDRLPDVPPRSNHYSSLSDSYGASSSSNRQTYTASSSRSHRTDEWRPADSYPPSQDHHRDDSYSSSRKDDRTVSRKGEHWSRSIEEHQVSESSRSWRDNDDKTHNADSRTWVSSSSLEGRRSGRDWRHDDGTQDRERGQYERDSGWDDRVGHSRRSGRGGQEWRADDGWPEDKRGRNWEDRNEASKPLSKTVNEHTEGKAGTDRQWEPAATWKSREHEVGDQDKIGERDVQQNSNRPELQQQRNGNKKKNKKNQQSQKRDRRREPSNMNNWERRDNRSNTNNATISTSPKKKQPRSRSPAYSTYSRSSFRSRSRSLTPPRRFRDETQAPRNQEYETPKRKRSPNYRKRGRSAGSSFPLPSRRSIDERGRPRRSSFSSLSSMSRSRSRSSSESPDVRKKRLHRLPTATTISDIDIQAKLPGRQQGRQAQRNGNSNKKSARSSGKNQARTSNFEEKPASSNKELMPPPALPVANPKPSRDVELLDIVVDSTDLSSRDGEPASTSPITSTKKKAGFKPIGETSASLKRFFSADGEDTLTDSPNGPHHLPMKPMSAQLTLPPEILRAQANLRAKQQIKRPPPSPSPPTIKSPVSEVAIISQATSENPRAPADIERSPSLPVNGSRAASVDPSQTPNAQNDAPRDRLYTLVNQVGEGTFGKVYKARNTVTGMFVALKRIRMETEKDGFPVTSMREIKLLQSLRHKNVVHLHEMMVSDGFVYMVFEYMDHDLTGILGQSQFIFDNSHLKSLCEQMLAGLAYLHHKGVIHRDIKASNILVNNKGELKLADLNLARFYQKRRRSDYTNRVITLWYRPPELLLGTTIYGPEVDMWSAGCIMLELFCKKPVFQGNDEINQLEVVYRFLGTPTVECWPGLVHMPWYELVRPRDEIRNRFRDLFQKWLSPAGLDLAERLLTYDPNKRATATQALETPYFLEEEPKPSRPTGLSNIEGEWHEFESKIERAKKRRKIEASAKPIEAEPCQQ